jgi:hypothetical protein
MTGSRGRKVGGSGTVRPRRLVTVATHVRIKDHHG